MLLSIIIPAYNEESTVETVQICRFGYKILEVPISYRPRTVLEGKKIKWKDGIKAIWTLFHLRFQLIAV